MQFARFKMRIWRRRDRARIGVAAVLVLAAAPPALAQTAALPSPASNAGPADANSPAPAKSDSLWERDKLLGDLSGVRTALENKGISLNVLETSEVLGNPTGGVRQGAIYEGAALMTLSVDTQKLANVPNGTFYVSAYQIRGRGLTANNLDNLNVVSSDRGAGIDPLVRAAL